MPKSKSKKSKKVVNEKYLQRYYLRPSNPGSLSSVHTFVKNYKQVGLAQAQKSLNKLSTYALYRPLKRKPHIRRPVIVFQPNQLIQVDLAEFSSIKTKNRGYAYLFLGIDVFSKKAYFSLLKHKSTKEIAAAISKLLAETKFKLRNLQSDFEPAIYSKVVQAILKKHKVNFYSTRSKLKANVVERLVKTIKSKIYRLMHENKTQNWFQTVEKVIKSYNESIHSSHGHVPNKIGPKNYSQVFQNLYSRVAQRKRKRPSFVVGQSVRISQPRLTFSKDSTIHWSPEVFKIHSLHTAIPVVSYLLSDKEDNVLNSSFVEADLQAA